MRRWAEMSRNGIEGLMLSRYSPPFFLGADVSSRFLSSFLPTPNSFDQKPRFFGGASGAASATGGGAGTAVPVVGVGAGGRPVFATFGACGFSPAPNMPAIFVIRPRDW